MKFKVFILQLKFKNIALFCGFFFAFLQVNGQFFIPENSIVTLHTPLVSQEQLNIINSSIAGSSTFVFNAAFPQQLLAEQKISLPNIRINNTSDFTFNASLEIEGNLSITTSTVYVLKPIELNGDLTVDASSSIEGIDLIIHQTHLKPQPSPLNFPQNFWSFKIVYTHLYHTSNLLWQAESKPKPAFFYTSTTPHRLAISISTPPPEYRG